MVSTLRLIRRKTLPRAAAPWVLDSGGFSEIGRHGRWTISSGEYASFIRRCQSEVGQMRWAAPQDWMCEPQMLKKTGKTVAEHQALSVRSVLDLRERAVPVIPVLQGWRLTDYWRHVDMYQREGIDLEAEPVVGLGSVCRRQGTDQIHTIVATLQPLRLHGFGVKASGFRKYAHLLTSSDSMAWSYDARRRYARPDGPPRCPHGINGANCLDCALTWREKMLERVLGGWR